MPFMVASADIDERPEAGERPPAMAARLARLKAEEVAEHRPNALVLGADTVVVVDGTALGKPADAAEAGAMLRRLRGRDHRVITAVWLHDSRTGEGEAALVETGVVMRTYADEEVAASIAAGTPFDKAGAYAIQDEVFAPVVRIEGCYCNVVGLPLWSVYRMLARRPPACPLPPSRARAICVSCPDRSDER
jgi:MAF protein